MATKKKATAKTAKSEPKKAPSPEEKEQLDRAYREFKSATKVLDVFIKTNTEVLSAYGQYIEDYNTKRQNVDKIVRALDIPYEEWHRSERVTYDPTELYNNIGKAKFLEIGGKIGSTATYTIDDTQIELAVAKKLITEDESTKKVTPAYRAPKDR